MSLLSRNIKIIGLVMMLCAAPFTTEADEVIQSEYKRIVSLLPE